MTRTPKRTRTRRPGGIPCPHCAAALSSVTRTTSRGDSLQRVRQCSACRRKFLTREATGKSDTRVNTLASDVVSLIHAMGIVPNRNPTLDPVFPR